MQIITLIMTSIKLIHLYTYYYCRCFLIFTSLKTIGAVVIVIMWLLDLQLPVQSVAITTNVESLNPTHGEVYLCDKVCQ